jgi:hypothetical protein
MQIPKSLPTWKGLVVYVRTHRPQVLIFAFLGILSAAVFFTYNSMTAIIERNNYLIQSLKEQLDLNDKEIARLKMDKSQLLEQLSDSIRKDDIFRIAESTSEIVRDLTQSESGEYRLVAITDRTDGAVETSFHLEEKVGFGSGSYSLEEVYEETGFIESIMTYVSTITQFHNDGKLKGAVALQGCNPPPAPVTPRAAG